MIFQPDWNAIASEVPALTGEAFVLEMALRYGHADPERLIRKARYFTVVDRIDTILHGGDRALPGDEAESWQRLRALLRNDA